MDDSRPTDRQRVTPRVVSLIAAPLHVKLLTLGPLLGTIGSIGAILFLPEPLNLRVFAAGMLVSGLGVAVFLVVAIRWAHEHRRRATAGLCPFCGYDLRASTGRCPECGRPSNIQHSNSANSAAAIDRQKSNASAMNTDRRKCLGKQGFYLHINDGFVCITFLTINKR